MPTIFSSRESPNQRGREMSLVERVQESFKPAADPAKAKELYAQAEATFHKATEQEGVATRKTYLAAAKQYAAAAKLWPHTALEEDALMMAGESLFFADHYPKATVRYAEVIKKYPSTRHMDRIDQRRFIIAKYWLAVQERQTEWDSPINMADPQRPSTDLFGHAVKLLDRIRLDSPTGKLADDATMAAAVAHFQRENYHQADELFADIRDNFPRSEHQFGAHMLALKCKQLMYRGSDYDGGVLGQSEQIVQQMVRLFPDETAKHREEIDARLKDIRLQQAERDYVMAQYYDSRKEYGAARVYYDAVRRDFQDTNLALESESRLAQIDGLPAVPVSYFQWIVDAIPQEQPAKPLIARDTVDTKRR